MPTPVFLNRCVPPNPNLFYQVSLSRAQKGREPLAYTMPWVNFINVLTHSFYAHRSQKRKKLLDLTAFFVLLGSVRENAALKMLMKLTPDECLKKLKKLVRGQFHQRSTSSFYARISQKCRKDRQVKQLFCAFGIFACKSCS